MVPAVVPGALQWFLGSWAPGARFQWFLASSRAPGQVFSGSWAPVHVFSGSWAPVGSRARFI